MSKRKKLTSAERAEKKRFKDEVDRLTPPWERKNDEKLTQERLGQIAGMSLQGKPYSQGMVWQYLTPSQDTRMPVKFVQFVASMLGFDPGKVGPDFAVPEYIAHINLPSPLGQASIFSDLQGRQVPAMAAPKKGQANDDLRSMLDDLTDEELIETLLLVVSSLEGHDQVRLAEKILASARESLERNQ